ncbi:hypothetical protein BJ875DRAFT_546542 [Amylocarpus encephaloides]|uniref:Uncharacterized protein n=1 Tax=Amylocarpus encephaloides TaxID=45428 RepID=A0A9P8C162_9HELO|nr:hypothetical protein BJ875DRAFT_546542 [Amylocarpus encephaloides]
MTSNYPTFAPHLPTRWDHLKRAASIFLHTFSWSRKTSSGPTGIFRRPVSVVCDNNGGFHRQRLGAAPSSNQGHEEKRLGHKPTIASFLPLLGETHGFIWGSQWTGKKAKVFKTRDSMPVEGEIPKPLQLDAGDVVVLGLFSTGNKVPKERILKLRHGFEEWLNRQIWLNVIRLHGLRAYLSWGNISSNWNPWIQDSVNYGANEYGALGREDEGAVTHPQSLEIVLCWGSIRVSVVILFPVILSFLIGMWFQSRNPTDLATIQIALRIASYVVTAGSLLYGFFVHAKLASS